MLDDAELARRSIRSFGEMVAALGRCAGGAQTEIRRRDALGARIDADANPWFDAAIVPAGATPPADDALLPHCLWTIAAHVPGRVEDPRIATPCMGVALDALSFDGEEAHDVEEPSLAVVGDVNDRAYGAVGAFAPLVKRLRDDRVRAHGLRDGEAFVCVALSIAIDDDLGIHYVATEAAHRRRGLASRLLRTVLANARAAGMRSATLQASADGLAVYERLGFRRVATLRGYLRPNAA